MEMDTESQSEGSDSSHPILYFIANEAQISETDEEGNMNSRSRF